jgi:hypothetical protein
MKTFPTLILFFLATIAFSQKEIKSTDSFTIQGEIKSPKTVMLSDLSQWKTHDIGDVVITNHTGERRGGAKQLKGVLLRDVLESIEIKSESPMQLSEFYFVCKATDGYKVIFSWNEIHNSKVGDAVFIITEKEGKPASQLPESILLLSPQDFKTGRRHIKSLQVIEVKRAQ